MPLKTGIKWLDEIFGESVPRGSVVIFKNDPTVESDSFVYQTFFETVRNGTEGIFLTATRSLDSVAHDFSDFGWDIDMIRENVDFVDSYAGFVGSMSDAEYIVRNPNDINEILYNLERAVETKNNAIVIISSLSTIIDACGEEKFVETFSRLRAILNKAALSIIQFTQWPYDPRVIDLVRSANGIIDIKGIEQRVVFGQYFTVSKADWLDSAVYRNKSLLFKVIKPGGVRLFIPKIIITGPYHAGKSSFIHTLSDRALSVDRLGTTIALDHGQIERNGLSADLFGTPGQERFNPIIRMIAEGAIGVVLVVDSTDPDSFPRAREMIDTIYQKGLPLVLAANKQDAEGAIEPTIVRKELGLATSPVLPCIATEKASVLSVFDALVDQIMEQETPDGIVGN